MSVRMIRSHILSTGCLIGMITLAGCGGDVKETLGMTRVAPDEFRVVSRPPLTIPPQFSLLPPSVDATPPGVTPTTEYAREMVLGSPAPVGPDGEPLADGENAILPAEPRQQAALPAEKEPTPITAGSTEADKEFLQQFGVTEADPSIRQKLVEERVNKQLIKEEESWWNRLSIIPDSKDPTVNATKEMDRIQENKDAGKPVTEGETPVKKPTDLGILGRIFDDE
jgi:hypothetical protein